MKEYIVTFTVFVTAVDKEDAIEKAEKQLAQGGYNTDVEER